MQVVAVVGQSSEPVRTYIEETGLPFDILIDKSRAVIKTYGVRHTFCLSVWNIAKPAVFLIDRSGAIRYSFVANSQREFPAHAEIVKAIDTMLTADR